MGTMGTYKIGRVLGDVGTHALGELNCCSNIVPSEFPGDPESSHAVFACLSGGGLGDKFTDLSFGRTSSGLRGGGCSENCSHSKGDCEGRNNILIAKSWKGNG